MWIVALAMLGALVGCGDASSDKSTATVTSPTATSTQPAQTVRDARAAVDKDDYTAALAIATALGTAQADSVRRWISNRIARRVFTALRSGNRGLARTLIIQGKQYGTTQQSVRARASYKAAKARAAQQRRAAAAAKAQRVAAKARRQAQQAKQSQAGNGGRSGGGTSGGGSTGGGGGYAGMNCDEIGHSFTVPPGSDPEHDRDGDGIACESQ